MKMFIIMLHAVERDALCDGSACAHGTNGSDL